MPFKSKQQSKWAFATHQEWADKWGKQTDYKHLPDEVPKKHLRPKKKLQVGGLGPLQSSLTMEQLQPIYNKFYDDLQLPPLLDKRKGSSFPDDGFDRFNMAHPEISTEQLKNISRELALNYVNRDTPLWEPQRDVIPYGFTGKSWANYKASTERLRQEAMKDAMRKKKQTGGTNKGIQNLDGSWSPGYYDKKTDSWVQTGDDSKGTQGTTASTAPAQNYVPTINMPGKAVTYSPFGKNPWLPNQANQPNTPPLSTDLPLTPEEEAAALADVNNAPGNDTQYFNTGFTTDPVNGQKTANPYDGNNINQDQNRAEANQTAAGAGPGTNHPKQLAKKEKTDPFDVFLGIRGAAIGANFLSGIHARNQQNQYDYNQQTALGQMSAMPVSNFQYTPNNMYAQQGGMMNPYSYYAKFGGNLKNILREHGKWSNDAGPMNMTGGKHPSYPEKAMGGYSIDDMVVKDLISKLMRFGKGPHPYKQWGGFNQTMRNIGNNLIEPTPDDLDMGLDEYQTGGRLGILGIGDVRPPAQLPGDTLSQSMINPLAHQLWSNGENYRSINNLKTLPFNNQPYTIKPKDISKIKSELDNIGFFGRTLDAVLPYRDINLKNYESGGDINQDDMILRKGGNPAKRQASHRQAQHAQQGQQQQVMQLIQAYAQIAGQDPRKIMQQLQQMQPQQQQQAIQQMAQAVQQGQQQQQPQQQQPQQQQMDPNQQAMMQQQGMMKEGGNWLRGAVNPDHEGWCTPMSNPKCTGHRRAFALMMKKNHGFHKN